MKISLDAEVLGAITTGFEKYAEGIGIDAKVKHVHKQRCWEQQEYSDWFLDAKYPGKRSWGSFNNCFLFVSTVTTDAITVDFQTSNTNQWQ